MRGHLMRKRLKAYITIDTIAPFYGLLVLLFIFFITLLITEIKWHEEGMMSAYEAGVWRRFMFAVLLFVGGNTLAELIKEFRVRYKLRKEA